MRFSPSGVCRGSQKPQSVRGEPPLDEALHDAPPLVGPTTVRVPWPGRIGRATHVARARSLHFVGRPKRYRRPPRGTRYPTTAQRLVPLAELVEVGEFDSDDGPHGAHMLRRAKWSAIGAAVLCLAWLTPGGGDATSEASPSATAPLTLVALGDSIPFGSDCGGCIGYVTLHGHAARRAPHAPVTVLNRAEHNDLDSRRLLAEVRESSSLRSELATADLMSSRSDTTTRAGSRTTTHATEPMPTPTTSTRSTGRATPVLAPRRSPENSSRT